MNRRTLVFCIFSTVLFVGCVSRQASKPFRLLAYEDCGDGSLSQYGWQGSEFVKKTGVHTEKLQWTVVGNWLNLVDSTILLSNVDAAYAKSVQGI